MKRFCFFAIIFTLLGIAYTSADNRAADMKHSSCCFIYTDTTSLSQADSLALAMAESMALLMGDSLAMAVPADSAVAVSALVVDSLAVDSVALKKIIPDSLIVGYMPERTSWKYFDVKERSASDVVKLKTL